jgi:hypothetical protein
MIKRAVLILVAAVAVSGGVARAQGMPWGGSEDGGFLPPNKPTTSCENALEKAVAKAVACVAKCHLARAAGKIANEAAEDDCESNVANAKSCKAKFNKVRDKLLGSGNCPACLTQVEMDQLFAQSEAFVDSTTNAQVYCGQ